MAESVFRLPPPLDPLDDNLADTFKKWRRQVDIYMTASRASLKPKKTNVAIILHCAGPQMVEIFDQFNFETEEQKDNPDDVIRKLEEYCCPRTSEVLQSFRFWKISYKQPFNSFLIELKVQADKCNFQEKERMIRDKIVFSVTGKLQELLLRERNLNLEKAVEICLAYEATVNCAKEMCEVGSENVNKVNNWRTKATDSSFNKDFSDSKNMDRYAVKCRFCGYKHEFEKLKCPAWGKVCEACKGRNHFKAVCKKTVKIVKEKNEEADEGYDHYMWMAPVEMKNSNRLSALLIVNDTEVRFHLDTGADVNAICQRYVKKDQVRPTSVKLAMWNKSKLSPIGETTLNVKNPKNDEIRSVTFIVVSNDLMCLLGSKTCQEMGFVFVNGKAFVSKIDIDHEMSNLGDLGEVKLNVDSALPARILPCQRLPIALKSKVQKELHSLVKRGVLIPETEPTDWVSQMAVVQKTNGKLRICIDPQPLNKALKREYYTLPILEDILPNLKHAKIFSKLDVQEAFWHIRLDEESSKLTTMITPFGRYRWARLPFGL
ncbi:uncharacterized protein [Palaemon carinicauda]|uniref:uncharacterized protein n=1 Tax=Palaemon carinicauda TaxID=392227 RepID=UPI0035B5F95D